MSTRIADDYNAIAKELKRVSDDTRPTVATNKKWRRKANGDTIPLTHLTASRMTFVEDDTGRTFRFDGSRYLVEME